MSIKDQYNNKLETAYSLLDIVKYSTKTVINSLNHEDDKFGLVTFSDFAHIVVNVGPVSNVNSIIPIVDNIKTQGMANVYMGLQKAFDMVSYDRTSILLFTDGSPTSWIYKFYDHKHG